MAYRYSISTNGLKLIKAFEGFRPTATTLVSGQQVIGYGHRYAPDEPAEITKKHGDTLLKADLEAAEALVNDHVFAPLSQGQFDALVSLVFNIGARAFLSSRVLHNLNNGQPLAAAAGFDEWRKSVIAGKTYVVDALVRRRAAEKAMFLRPSAGDIPAPRNELTPRRDIDVQSGEDDLEVFGASDIGGLVATAPYALTDEFATETDADHILTLNQQVLDEDTDTHTDIGKDKKSDENIRANPDTLSPIALAAAEVSDRLDALIPDDAHTDDAHNIEDWVVAKSETDRRQDLAVFDEEDQETLDITVHQDQDFGADQYAPANDPTSDPAIDQVGQIEQDIGHQVFVDEHNPDIQIHRRAPDSQAQEPGGFAAYWTALIVGLTLLGGGLWKIKFTDQNTLDDLSKFLAPVAVLTGVMLVLGGLYYLIKAQMRRLSR